MVGTPRRPHSWLDNHPRRARLEAGARRAYPWLKYRRRQRPHGPIHIYEVDLPVPGYEARHVIVTFGHDNPSFPRVYADGPSDATASPHRYAERGRTCLCIWHPDDPPGRRWVPSDGLLSLFGMTIEHLFKEGWWREYGEWLGDEAPHSSPAPSDGKKAS
jgi:hypothetical protein